MRILIVNKIWNRRGGLEQHMFDVRDVFEERGHEVVAFAMQDELNEPVDTEGFFVTNVEFRGGRARERLRAAERAVYGHQTVQRLRRLLEDVPVDAAHVLHGYHQLGPAFMKVLQDFGVPTVLSMHDYKMGCPSYRLYNDRTGQICTRCFDKKYDFLFAPALTGCWDGSRLGGALLSLEAASTRLLGTYSRVPGAVMTVNQLQAVGAMRMGVPQDRIHVVPHYAKIDAAVPPRLLGVVEPDATALYVGRLVVEKGVDVLIRAAAATNTAVRVVGDGRSENDLRGLALQLGADVTFLGRLPADAVADEMRRAGVLVVPSTWHEVWGLVINEAFNAGLPVIGTDVGAIGELLGDGRGVLVPPGDPESLGTALRQVLGDEVLQRTLATTARRWAAVELTRGRFIESLCDVWRSVGVVV